MDGLVEDTLSNVRSKSPSSALTGPIVRGDSDTVRLHLETLDRIAPQWNTLYRAMARATVDMAFEAERIDSPQRDSILELL